MTQQWFQHGKRPRDKASAEGAVLIVERWARLRNDRFFSLVRHCAKCQGKEWVDARIADLLPVPYFHVVFTLPSGVAEIAFHNKAVVYALLVWISAETLQTIAANPNGWAPRSASPPCFTPGQAMTHHPHVHCVVPGGGLSPDRSRWVACRPGFFLPVRVLSRLFRRLFLTALAEAFAHG